MLVAALDTATLTLSCALCEVGEGGASLVAEKLEHAPARRGPQGPTGGHGGRLPAALSELLELAGAKLADVQGWAVGLGPGSFTGLRIGLATWKGLAYAHQRPIAGASSLAAMALAAAPSAPEGVLLLPLLDARKGELYAGFYEAVGGSVAPVAPDAALPAGPLLERLQALRPAGDIVAFGEGLLAYAEALAGLPRLGAEVPSPPGLAVARLCAAALLGAAYDAARLYALEPHYVRASEAEVKFPHGLPPVRP